MVSTLKGIFTAEFKSKEAIILKKLFASAEAQ